MPPKSCLNPRSESLTNLNIGIFLGGDSSERTISLRSGKAVYSALKRSGLQVKLVDPSRPNGHLKPDLDLAFIALHGTGGEDGTIQRNLERLKIPYTGSGPSGSRNAFSKKIAKRLFIRHRILTPEYAVMNSQNWGKVLSRFSVPFFVKPVANGSSVGVFCVHDKKRSEPAIRKALRKFGELILEEQIHGREFTVGVLGHQPLPVVELTSKRAFYDYKAKYTRGLTTYHVPAQVSKKLEKRLKRTALRVHRILGLRDFSRVDLLTDTKEKVYVLEANSIPGLTELSLLPKAAKAAGIDFQSLCLRMLLLARKRVKRKRR